MYWALHLTVRIRSIISAGCGEILPPITNPHCGRISSVGLTPASRVLLSTMAWNDRVRNGRLEKPNRRRHPLVDGASLRIKQDNSERVCERRERSGLRESSSRPLLQGARAGLARGSFWFIDLTNDSTLSLWPNNPLFAFHFVFSSV